MAYNDGTLGVLLFIQPKTETSMGSVRVLGIYSNGDTQNAEYDRLKKQYPEYTHMIFTEYVKLDAPAKMTLG